MPDPEGPLRPVPDCGGLVEEIAICVPPLLFGADSDTVRAGALFALGALAKALPEKVRLIVLTERGARITVTTWLDALNLACMAEVAPTAPDGDMTLRDIWIQDSLLATVDGAGRTVLIRTRSDNRGDPARWLADHVGYETRTVNARATGGDQLVGDSFLLHSGETTVERLWGIGEGRHVRFGYAMDDRPGYPASGPLVRPGLHLDLVASVTGVQRGERPVIVVADPDADGRPYRFAKAGLDACSARLDAAGFAVIRNPVPHAAVGGVTKGGRELRPRSYNNVVAENSVRPGRTKPLLFMPAFGGEEPSMLSYDDANAEIWSSLGFDVMRIGGWGSLAIGGGALRCSSKVLRRSAAAGGRDQH